MKTLSILATLWLLTALTDAQIVVPGQGKTFEPRGTGDANSGGVTVLPADAARTPQTSVKTYLVLADSRDWTSTDGKIIKAKLIAFEDMAVTVAKAADNSPVVPPANPTVVRAGKVRLLMNQKPVELPLDRLGQADREFIEKIRASHAKKSPSSP